MRLISNGLAFAGNLFVHPLSRLVRRDPDLWAFGGADGRFDGNAKYLFLWMSRHPAPVKTVWITPNRALAGELRRRGLAAHYRWSPRGMAAALRAGLYLVNDNSSDINFSLSGGAKIFNLWHGVGLKNVLFGTTVGSGAMLRAKARNPLVRIRNMRRYQRSDWALATSPEMAEAFFGRCFDLPVSRVPALGYPRLDPVLDGELKALGASFDDFSVLEPVPGITRRIIYLPTLRKENSDLLSDALPDLARLSAALTAQSAQLFLKIHPKTPVKPHWIDGLPPNIRLLPVMLDVYPVLDRFDALITDYSSLFFDWIYSRDSGVLLYTFDYDEYVRTERDLAWDYDQVTVGARAGNFEVLCDAIRDGRVFAPLDPARLAELRARFWAGDARLPTASERIVDFLLNRPREP